jgi:hypothetical protein
MKIDIHHEPSANIFQDRGKYIRISAVLLSLVVCGMLLMAYGILSETQFGETMETVALGLFVGPGLIFVYFGGKLSDYKKLTPEQKNELADLGRKHPEISTYFARVAKQGREPIMAEYEACKDWVENLSNKQARTERTGKK